MHLPAWTMLLRGGLQLLIDGSFFVLVLRKQRIFVENCIYIYTVSHPLNSYPRPIHILISTYMKLKLPVFVYQVESLTEKKSGPSEIITTI
jgi:hypothetical protein